MNPPKNKTVVLLKLVRYPNLLIMAATQLFAALCLTYEGFTLWQHAGFMLTLFATLLIAAGGYIINDIFDATADTVNKPEKTYITAENRNFYAQVYYGFSALGVLLGLLANVAVGVVCACMVVLLYFYSFKLKRTVLLGNIAVALMSAAVVGVLQLVLPHPITVFIWLYASFAFVTTLVREVVKDIEDEEGDRMAGYFTFPVVKGVTLAKTIAIILAGSMALLVITFATWGLLHGWIWAFFYLIILVVIPSVGLVLLLYWAKEKDHYSQASTLCKLIMVAGILSMYFIST